MGVSRTLSKFPVDASYGIFNSYLNRAVTSLGAVANDAGKYEWKLLERKETKHLDFFRYRGLRISGCRSRAALISVSDAVRQCRDVAFIVGTVL
jgi:hypothetical protein